MDENEKTGDAPADVRLGPVETLSAGFRRFERHHFELEGGDGPCRYDRDLLRVGLVVGVLPVDVKRGEVVLVRQFRIGAHLGLGRGSMLELVAGIVEPGEEAHDAAARECREEIGVAPARMVELFTLMTSPAVTDEVMRLFLADIDAAVAPAAAGNPDEGEVIAPARLPIGAALDLLAGGRIGNGPLIVALQWLAAHRDGLADLLDRAAPSR